MSNEHTSQGLSQRLHDKGFRGEHVVYHKIQLGTVNDHKGFDYVPCYTFTELWQVLPDKIEGIGYKILSACFFIDGETEAKYMLGGRETVCFAHKSPAEAVGLLLEWLIDEGHMDIDEENDIWRDADDEMTYGGMEVSQ